MNLICFPYAGGDSRSYTVWKPYLSDKLVLHTIELPGRGKRYGEPLAKTIDQMILKSLDLISRVINYGPYVVYGHSLGSALAYALILQIIAYDWPKPSHVIFSGALPPYENLSRSSLTQINDEEFIKHILSLGGTPQEVFENKDLRNLFLPILRTDFCALENYSPTLLSIPFQCNCSVFYGKADVVTERGIRLWDKIEGSKVSYREFEGGHFFIHTSARKVVEEINRICYFAEMEVLQRQYL